jgi:hypothetical protein
MKMRTKIVTILIMLALLCGCSKQIGKSQPEESLSFILFGTKYFKPMSYINSVSFLDGGTLLVRLKDENGKELLLFRDGAFDSTTESGYSNTFGKIWVNSNRAEKGGIIVSQDKIEKFLYALVREAVWKELSAEDQKIIQNCFNDVDNCPDFGWAYNHIFVLDFINPDWAKNRIEHDRKLGNDS